MSDIKYNNTETKHTEDGKTITRKVVIHGGKGHKSVSVRLPNGKSKNAKRPLSEDEIRKICAREFIPRLFSDCKCNVSSQQKTTRKRKTHLGGIKTRNNQTRKQVGDPAELNAISQSALLS
jgi:hypothetical protein